MPASGCYFLAYEYVKDYTAKEFGTEGYRGLVGTIFAGGSAGIANWVMKIIKLNFGIKIIQYLLFIVYY